MSRIRANKITNQAADGAPVVEKGLIVTGILTATGNISVGGTLTYEDVTNVDSVGVITARSTIDAQGDVSIADKIIHSGDTNTAIRFPAADTISFETAGTERLRIDSSGLIGIGLSVYADTSASEYDGDANNLVIGTGSGNEGITILSGQNVSNYGSIFFADGTGATNSKRGQLRYEQNNEVMSFYTAGVEKVRINAAGNVGIGTDNPTAPLQINHVSPKIILEDDDNAADVSIANIGGAAVYSSNSDVIFQTADTSEKFRIVANGAVGIGTNNPTEQLEIYNGTSSGDATLRMRSLDGSTKITLDARGTNDSSYIYFTDSSATYNSFIQRSHSSNAAFAGLRYCYDGSANEAFRISESGGFDMGGAGYGTAGQVLRSNGNAPPTWGALSYAIVAEIRSGGSDGGTLTANTWMTRAINTEIADPDGIVSISSNQFTLQAGTYLIEWSAPAWRCDRHVTRLYDVTNSAARGNATLEFSQDSGSYTQSSSRGFARVTISGATVYKLETKGNVTRANDGLGLDPNNLASCIYAMAKIYKEA